MASIRETEPAPAADEAHALQEALGASAEEAWGRLRDIQIATQVLGQYEALRLEARLGAEHPRVLELRSRLEDVPVVAAEADREWEAARIRPGPAPTGAAILLGHVRDPKGRGLPGLSARLEDAKGAPVAAVKPALTGAHGEFTLAVDEAAAAPPEGSTLAIRNRQGTLLHSESVSGALEPGQVRRYAVTLYPDADPAKPATPAAAGTAAAKPAASATAGTAAAKPASSGPATRVPKAKTAPAAEPKAGEKPPADKKGPKG
ncbi:MAG TPA: hypothetical protein VJ385_22130 [Fibrobacteria bacterium]|nr:hypothetical protein [Fibrobacteria bacterium]